MIKVTLTEEQEYILSFYNELSLINKRKLENFAKSLLKEEIFNEMNEQKIEHKLPKIIYISR